MKTISLIIFIFLIQITFAQKKSDIAVIGTISDKLKTEGIKIHKESYEAKLQAIFKKRIEYCKKDSTNCQNVLNLKEIEIEPSMIQLNKKEIKNGNSIFSKVSYGKVDTLFTHIKSVLNESKKLSGAFNFNLSSSNTENKEQIKYGIGADIKKGSYPSEFTFNSEINVEFNNGKLTENLSNLTASYNYYFLENLSSELYVFTKRSSNNYLNIDQRYEAGIGYIYNYYSGKNINKKISDKKILKRNLNKKGLEVYKKFMFDEFLSKDSKFENLTSEFLAVCTNDVCSKIELKKEEKEAFEKVLKKTLNSFKKEGSKFRLAFLTGFNYEVEQVKDPLEFIYQDSTITRNYKPKAIGRLIIAPILEFYHNEFTLKSRCYFKLAVSDGDFSNIVEVTDSNLNSTLIDEKKDFRVEWDNSLEMEVSKNVGVGISLNYQFINAPKRDFVNIGDSNLPDYKLLESDSQYLGFNIDFTLKL